MEAARLTNPDKDIFLLGDRDNKWLGTAKNTKHYFFDDYQQGSEIETFNQFYRPVQGKKHKSVKGGKDWLKFVFKRWFYVNNFLISKEINDFWHFDSDNMILDALEFHKAKFRAYDCTEQCNGMCINGYISRRSVVLKYVNKINDLFQDDEFLKEQQKEYQRQVNAEICRKRIEQLKLKEQEQKQEQDEEREKTEEKERQRKMQIKLLQ